MIEISFEEIFNINTYNKNNLFYNNWIKVLMAAERSISELPAQLIWKLSNEMIERIKSESIFDKVQLDTYYNLLARSCRIVKIDGKEEHREHDTALRSATAVFTLVMFRLLNARKDDEDVESLSTYPYIKGIGELLVDDDYSQKLSDYFLNIDTDDNGNPTIYNVENPIEIKIETEKPKTNKRGRKQESLFIDESEENIKKRADEFIGFIKSKYHNKHIIVTEKNNYINKAIYAFAVYWNKNHIICDQSYKSGTRIYRFLTEICKIETNTNEATYKSAYSKWINDNDFKEKSKYLDVESYLNK